MARRKPADSAFYRKVFTVDHTGSSGGRTVRIAAYPPREGNSGPTVTLGIGYSDSEAFAKIFFEVTEDNWKHINTAVREALRAAAAPVKPKSTKPKSEATVMDLTGARPQTTASGATPAPARRPRRNPNVNDGTEGEVQ